VSDSPRLTASSLWAAFVLFSALGWAQGGPPFRSDDPDTPGNRNWEINIFGTGDRNPAAGSYEVPNVDINYGVGHRIQLKFEIPLSMAELRGPNGHVAAGLGNSLMGVKWRFYAHHPKSQLKEKPGERESTCMLLISKAIDKEQNVMAKGPGSENALQRRTAQIASKGTAREVYLKAISEDRRFRLLPSSGETLTIVGARPPAKAWCASSSRCY